MTRSKTQPAGWTDCQAPAQQPPTEQAGLLGTPPRQMKVCRSPTGPTAPEPWGSRGSSHRTQRLLPGARGAAPLLARRPAARCGHGRPCQVCEEEGGPGWHRWGLSAALNYSSPHLAGETCCLLLFLQRLSLIPLRPAGVPCLGLSAQDPRGGAPPAPPRAQAGERNTHQAGVNTEAASVPGPRKGSPPHAALTVGLTCLCGHTARLWAEA